MFLKLNKKIITVSVFALLLLLPITGLAFDFNLAQPTQTALVVPTFLNIILNVMWWVFMAVAVIFFMIIGMLFLTNLGNPEEVSKARRALIWGGVGVAVGILAFGIVRIIMNSLSL